MRTTFLLFLTFALCLFWVNGYSQPGYINYFKNYTVEDGLPSNTVYSICEDNDGFIWAATADGLCRFDGYNFKIFRDLSLDLTHNRKDFFRKVYKSKNGDLWIGMEYGLVSLNNLTGKFNNRFTIDKTITRENFLLNTIIPYSELDNGTIIASNSHHENILIDPKTRMVSYLFDTISPLFSAITIAFDKNRIALIKNGDIFIYEIDKDSYEHILHTNLQLLIYSDGGCLYGNFLYIAEKNRVVKIDIQKKTIVKDIKIGEDFTVRDPVSKINITPNGDLVLATKGYGIFLLDKDLNLLNKYSGGRNERFGLQSSIIESIYFDGGKNMWVGTDLGGMSCLAYNNRFGSSFYELLKGKFVSCFYRKNNFVFAGVYNEGLYRMDMDKKLTVPIKLDMDPKDIRSITELKGHLLLGSEKGLIDYDPETGINRVLFIDNINEEAFRYFLKENDSTIYAATNIRISQLIMRNTGLVVKELLIENFMMTIKGFNNEYIHCSRNKTNNKSQTRLGPLLVKLKNEFILEGCTRAIIYNNEMWVSETNGLLRLNGNYIPIDTFNYTNSVLKTRIMSMEISKDNIWISCDNNLFQFNIPSSTFYQFNLFDGLTNIEFVSNSSYKDQDGFLYFGSIDGFIRFHPDSIYLKTLTRKPIVTKIKIFNEEYIDSNKKFIDKLDLEHEQNTVFIEFSSPQPVFQDKIEYAYQLGNHGKWIYIGNTHSFWLTDLPPGNYQLNIKTTSTDGIWSESYVLMHIYIKPPFWQTWWFNFLMIVFILSILAIVIYNIATLRQRKKIRSLEKLQALSKERLRISKDLHDELGAGLSKIKFLSDLTLNEPDKEEQNKKLVAISDTSENVVNNMKELIWLMNTENATIDILAASIREYASDYLDEFDIALGIHFPGSLPTFPLSKNVYRHLFMIIKEALQNIVKHSEATEAQVELILNEKLVIKIKDNGKGFNVNGIKGNGIKNIKDRMAAINGDSIIESSIHGTLIMVSVELNDLSRD